MSKELMQIFNFNEAQVRTLEQNGEIWFVAQDVSEILDFDKMQNMIRMLDDDERGSHLVSTPGGMQHMTTINEPGLYAILNKSNKETVKPFQKWVNHEVLPAIRKTGHYAARRVRRPEIEATDHFKSYFNVARLIGFDRNQAAFAANAAAKRLTGADTLEIMNVTHLLAPVQDATMTPTDLGQHLGCSAQTINKKLADMGFQERVGKEWGLTEKGRAYGRLFDTNKSSGGVPITQLKWYSSILPMLGGNKELFKEPA